MCKKLRYWKCVERETRQLEIVRNSFKTITLSDNAVDRKFVAKLYVFFSFYLKDIRKLEVLVKECSKSTAGPGSRLLLSLISNHTIGQYFAQYSFKDNALKINTLTFNAVEDKYQNSWIQQHLQLSFIKGNLF